MQRQRYHITSWTKAFLKTPFTLECKNIMRKQIQHDLLPVNTTKLPLDLQFNDDQLLITGITLVIIFITISGYCNIRVLCFLKKRYQSKKSSKDLLQGHQAIADLVVTFFIIPLEVEWAPTYR